MVSMFTLASFTQTSMTNRSKFIIRMERQCAHQEKCGPTSASSILFAARINDYIFSSLSARHLFSRSTKRYLRQCKYIIISAISIDEYKREDFLTRHREPLGGRKCLFSSSVSSMLAASLPAV